MFARLLFILLCPLAHGGCAGSSNARKAIARLRPSALNIAVTAPDLIEHPAYTRRTSIVGLSVGVSIPLWPVPTQPVGPVTVMESPRAGALPTPFAPGEGEAP